MGGVGGFLSSLNTGLGTYAPLASLGSGLLGGLGQLIGGSPTASANRWGQGQVKDLYDLIRWHMLGKQGDVLSQSNQQSMIARNRQAMQPAYQQIVGNASRYAGMKSPQTWRMVSEKYLPLEAEFANQLSMYNTQATQQRDSTLLQILAQLSQGAAYAK